MSLGYETELRSRPDGLSGLRLGDRRRVLGWLADLAGAPRILVPAGCAVVLLAAFYLHAVWLVPNHDNDWLLVAAERLLAGGRYRVDFIESNPPFIIMLNVPAVLWHQWTGMAVYTAFSLYVCGLIMISAWLAAPSLRLLLAMEMTSPGLVVLGYVSILALQPGYDFGQREHLAVILLLPGLLWLSTREAGLAPPWRWTIAVALLFAAVAVFIKPYFLLLPLAFFAVRLAKLRSWRVVLDPAAAALGLVLALYVGTVVFLYPEYFSEVAIQRQVYFALSRAWISISLDMVPAVQILSVAVLAAMLAPLDRRVCAALSSLCVAAGLFLVVMLIQKRGLAYHLLPVIQLALVVLLLVGAVLLTRLRTQTDLRRRSAAALAAVVLASIAILAQPASDLVFAARDRLAATPLIGSLNRLAKGQSFLILTSGYQWGVPSMTGGRLASRSPSQLYLPGVIQLSLGTPAQQEQAARLRRFVSSELVADVENFRPHIVAVDLRSQKQALPKDFDILEYFMADPAFRQSWTGYRRVESVAGWDFYQRSTP